MAEQITYVYKAEKRNGETVKSTISATSQSAAVSKIQALGLTPLEVNEQDNSGLNRSIDFGLHKTVKKKDLSVAVRQLSSMIDAGLPIIRALATVEKQIKNKRLKEAFHDVTRDVEGGLSLSKALSKHPLAFPPIMVGMVKIGETGGFLDKTLDSLATNLEKDVKLQGKIKGAMAYPIVVSIVALIGVNVMLLFVVPIFANMFKSMGAKLPVPTQIMMNMSHVAPYFIPVLVLLILAYIFIWPKFKDREKVRNVLDPIKLKIPIFGKLYRKILISRFSKNISTMLSSGVPLMEALTIVGETSGNVVLERAVAHVASSVKDGKTITKPMSQQKIFPDMLVQMVAVGEESGALDKMFQNVSNYYEQEVNTATDQLTSLIEPLMIVVVGLLIGGMVISLYLPMFSLYSTLNKTANSGNS